MMLPVSLANVAITAGVFLWGGREGLAWMGGIQWAAIIFFVALSAKARGEAGAGTHGSTHAAAAAGGPAAHAAPSH
jgi:hypothetical protein